MEKTVPKASVCLKAAFTTFINSMSPLECVFYRLKTELANLSCVAIKGEKGGTYSFAQGAGSKS